MDCFLETQLPFREEVDYKSVTVLLQYIQGDVLIYNTL